VAPLAHPAMGTPPIVVAQGWLPRLGLECLLMAEQVHPWSCLQSRRRDRHRLWRRWGCCSSCAPSK